MTPSNPTTPPTTSDQSLPTLLTKYNHIHSLFYAQKKHLDALRMYKELLKEFSEMIQRRLRERVRQSRTGEQDDSQNADRNVSTDEDAHEETEEERNVEDDVIMNADPQLLEEFYGEFASDDEGDTEDAEERLENQADQIPEDVRELIRRQIRANADRFRERHVDEENTTHNGEEQAEAPASETEISSPQSRQQNTPSQSQDYHDDTPPKEAKKLPSFHKMLKEYERMEKQYKSLRSGCQHYERNCQIKAPCCGKYYGCRRCHDEAEMMHQIDRFAIKELQCLVCNTEQPVVENCKSCGIRFAEYICLTCNLFARPHVDTKEDIFHCDGCGICRVGDPNSYFHCDTCGLCIPADNDSHTCVKDASRRDCPVCFEDLHSSTQGLTRGSCGHWLHPQCYNGMLRSGNFRCPICAKSLIDINHLNQSIELQIQHNPMPDQYKRKAKLLCNECSKYSIADFHFVGMKCRHCQGYNTSEVSDIPQHREEEANEE